MPDLFSLSCAEFSTDVHVVAFQGEEGLSRPYRFEVGLSVRAGAELDLDAIPGSRATLTIALAEDRPPQVIQGVMASIELVHSWTEQSLYRAVLVPLVWTLSLSHHSRIFVDKSVPDIVEEVLLDSGLGGSDYELRLAGSYDPLLHVMQYHESNLGFVSRLMEREGIYYFFEHGDETEKLIITDAASFHDELESGAVRYVPATGDADQMALESLNTWRCRRPMLPAEVAIADYDYLKPSLALAETAPVDGSGQIRIYGENFRTAAEGQRIAKARAQAYLAQKKVFQGSGRVFNLRPGYRFKLEEHPQPSMNAEYLVTRLVHDGNQSGTNDQIQRMLGLDSDDEYQVEVEAIPKDVQYRPGLATPIPRIDGVLHAVVAGPANSAYAQLDDHGRYKVRLLLDERGNDDGTSSTWVRMLQFHGGGTEGNHFPLRKGTEVMIIFLGGDPDRPLICGAVPNAHKPAPVTVSNHTLNILVTGGSNYLAMQDEEGAQWIDLSTPPQTTWLHLGEPHSDTMGVHTHYVVLNTGGDCLFNIGDNQDIEIGGDLFEHVVGDVTEVYDSDQDSEVAGDQTLEVGCDRDIVVGADQTVEIGADNDIEVGADQTLKVGTDRDVTVGGDQTTQISGDQDRTVHGDQTTLVGGDKDLTVGGDVTVKSGGDVQLTVGGDWTDTIAGKYTHTVLSDCAWLNVGSKAEIAISANAAIKLSADAEMSLGAKVALAASISSELKASLGMEVTMGAKISCDMSASVAIEAGASIKNRTAEIVGRGIVKMDNTAGLRMLSQSLVLVA